MFVYFPCWSELVVGGLVVAVAVFVAAAGVDVVIVSAGNCKPCTGKTSTLKE